MKTRLTNRGFGLGEFEDVRGNKCSIQESSAAMEARIWLGSDTIGLKHFQAWKGGWTDINEPDEVNTMEEHYVANTRMELNQQQVADLLPHLVYFVEHGCLPIGG